MGNMLTTYSEHSIRRSGLGRGGQKKRRICCNPARETTVKGSNDFRAYPQNAEQLEKVRRVKGSVKGEPHWFFPQDLP